MVDPIGTEVEHQTEPLVGGLTLKHGWKRGSRKGAKTRREVEAGERRCLECLKTLRLGVLSEAGVRFMARQPQSAIFELLWPVRLVTVQS